MMNKRKIRTALRKYAFNAPLETPNQAKPIQTSRPSMSPVDDTGLAAIDALMAVVETSAQTEIVEFVVGQSTH